MIEKQQNNKKKKFLIILMTDKSFLTIKVLHSLLMIVIGMRFLLSYATIKENNETFLFFSVVVVGFLSLGHNFIVVSFSKQVTN